MRHTWAFLLVISLFITPWTCRSQDKKLDINTPNIIIILADDLGYSDVGFHGSDIKTPHIDRIANEGVRLERFYVTPICSPTRAGLMTGRYPIRFGMMKAVIPPYRDFGLDPNEDTLPEMLARAGYERRGCFGKWHLGHQREKWLPLNQGFTHFMGCYNGAVDYFTHERDREVDWHRNEETIFEKGYVTDLIADEVIKFINETPKDEAYFAYIPFTAPHSPFQAKEKDIAKYAHRAEKNSQIYAAMIDAMDQNIGRILKTIEERGDLDNTFILFASDNGGVKKVGDNSPMRGSKFSVFEGGIRVAAAAMWLKGNIVGGQAVTEQIGYIDLFPTLRAISGLKEEAKRPLDGINALTAMQGESIGSRTWFSYIDQSPQKVERFALHNDTLKLVVQRAAPDNEESVKEKNFLFQLDASHQEKENIYAQYPGQIAEMRSQLDSLYNLRVEPSTPRYKVGKKGFTPPKDWIIKDR